MRLYGIAALALIVAGAAGCSDDAYCFACGQADAGSEAISDAPYDAPETIAYDTLTPPDAVDAPETSSNCVYPLADCDLISLNQCEVNLETNAKNCGKCGNACALAHAVAKCAPAGDAGAPT